MYMEKWEMYNQDDDKRATVDMATAHYRQLVKSFLYVDRDELLYCPPGQPHISSQKHFQARFLTRFMPHSDELLLSRINVASLFSGDISRGTAETAITAVLEECLTGAYVSRSMEKLWGCYSMAWVPKTKSKGIYPPDSCPFHELHQPCLR